jgi:hypothetical protein
MKKILLLLVLVCAGCASISTEEISHANFAPLPPDYQQQIQAFMSGRLKDPYSATYAFAPAKKAFVQEGIAVGNRKLIGLVVPTNINAKNSFGGYVGAKLYYFMFADGQLYDVSDLLLNGRGKFLE